MASNTDNLQLYKKDPLTDGNDTFDIQTMMNDNWDKIDDQLGAQVVASPDKTPVSLVSGQQVITSPRVAPYNVKSIKGRTLVNLLGRSNFESAPTGFSQFQASTEFDTTNFTTGKQGLKIIVSSGTYGAITRTLATTIGKTYIVVFDFKNGNATKVWGRIQGSAQTPDITDSTKFTPAFIKFTATATSHVIEIDVGGAVGTYAYVDSVRAFEVPTVEYSALDSMTPAQVAAKYPYVDDVKPINTPYIIRYGENLIPPFYEWESLDVTAAEITGPYTYSIVTTSAVQKVNYTKIPAVPGQQYTYSGTFSSGTLIGIDFQLADGSSVSSTGFVTTNPLTVTAPANAVSLRVFTTNNATVGTFTFDKVMLNLGSTALPCKPRADDYLVFPTKLHSNIDRSVYDEITYRDGQYFKNSRFKELELDGTYTWTVAGSYTGFKILAATNITNMVIANNLVAKYDGKILQFAVGVSDGTWSDASANIVYIGVPNADSGWADGYTPTQAEMQAYFWGWHMCDPAGNTPYTSGTKAWARIDRFGTPQAEITTTLPTNKPTAPDYPKWTPYKFIHQLAAPTTEVIPVEGGITLHEGLNQLEVGAGMVVREKANPFYYTSDNLYYINNKNLGASAFKYRTARIMAVYRNATEDKVWTFNNGIGANTQQGFTAPTNYDPAAAYTITYLALDQYLLTGTVQTIDGEYSANLKTTVDILSHNQANILSRVSVLESQKAGKEQPQWITPTLLNGWVAVPGREPQYRRLTDGTVETRGAVKNGTMNAIVFMFLPGYRPGIQTDVPAYSYNGMSDIFGSANIYPAGGFVANAGSNTFFSIATRFSAEK
ncbi:hypothetical protein ACHHV8_25400 [Paenibacillus sp. TAB 01]|uniref:hypothetical protein n=1 Tax=Paenibacillus sp. TAB 01 TaxID=3368988 RepID=UPI003752F868